MEANTLQNMFAALYERESDMLFRYILARVGDREQAIDITQEVFSELWKMYRKGEPVRHERAFLFTVARNRIIDWYRKKKALSLDAMLDEDGDAAHAYEPADGSFTANTGLSAEIREIVAAINKLSPTYRNPVYLRLIEGLPPTEIAELLGVSADTVSVRVHRGIAEIRKLLDIHEPL